MTHPIPEKAIGFLLADVARLFRKSLEKEIGNSGLALTAGSLRVLAYIATCDGLRQSALAKQMDFEQMTMSAYVDILQDQGLVARVPEADDRRAKNIWLTAKGRSVLREYMPIMNAVYNRATHRVPPEHIPAFEKMLSTICENLAFHCDDKVSKNGSSIFDHDEIAL